MPTFNAAEEIFRTFYLAVVEFVPSIRPARGVKKWVPELHRVYEGGFNSRGACAPSLQYVPWFSTADGSSVSIGHPAPLCSCTLCGFGECRPQDPGSPHADFLFESLL